jgi:hypothetical protein
MPVQAMQDFISTDVPSTAEPLMAVAAEHHLQAAKQ